MNTADEAKLCSSICSTFEALMGDMWLGIVVETNRVLSVDLCWLKGLQFSVHLIDLLSILLRCNGFAGIQKTIVDQTGSRPPVTMTCFLVQVWLWEVLWGFFSVQPLIWSQLVVM